PFDQLEFMDRKMVGRSARFTQLAVASAQLALADSGVDIEKEDSFRVGVEIGTGIGGFPEIYEAAKSFSEGGRLSPFFAPAVIPNMPAGQIAMNLGLRGPNATITTACAASTQTLGDAFKVIQRGAAEVMLAG